MVAKVSRASGARNSSCEPRQKRRPISAGRGTRSSHRFKELRPLQFANAADPAQALNTSMLVTDSSARARIANYPVSVCRGEAEFMEFIKKHTVHGRGGDDFRVCPSDAYAGGQPFADSCS